MIRENSYKGKLFSVLGDSISTLGGYSEPYYASYYKGPYCKYNVDVSMPEDTWWGQVIKYLGAELLVNDSFSGSTVIKPRGCIVPSFACSDERTSGLGVKGICPDVIMIFMGINDWGSGARLEPKNETEKEDISIFSVAYSTMLEKLRKSYPQAELWCLTLPISLCKRKENFEFPYCYAGIHIEEYSKIIRTCAKNNNCKVIELYSKEDRYNTIDGFHPDKEGMNDLKNMIIKQL